MHERSYHNAFLKYGKSRYFNAIKYLLKGLKSDLLQILRFSQETQAKHDIIRILNVSIEVNKSILITLKKNQTKMRKKLMKMKRNRGRT